MDLLGGEDMIKVMVVYDEDPLYAGRLAEYVNQKETFPFQAMAFSDLEKLKAYCHSFSGRKSKRGSKGDKSRIKNASL